MSPVLLLGILLAISVAGNAWQYHEHGKDMVAIGTTKQLADDTKAAAQACTKGVDDLAKSGKDREKALLAAMKAVGPQVAQLQAEATTAARARPDNPGDLCGSLERYLRAQVKGERKLP